MDPKWNFSRYHEDVENFVLSRPENVVVIEKENIIKLGEEMDVEALYTPGHDPSCLSYKIGDALFTGDAYIPGIKVVTNFPRSNKQLAEESEQRLKDLEAQGYEILAGHFIECS